MAGTRRTARDAVTVLLAPLALLGVLALATTAAPGAGAAVAIGPDREVSFASGGVTFAASLRLPADGAGPVPAVLIVGGTGNVDRNGNSPDLPGVALDPYLWMADELSAAGVASLRYDKLGTGATGLGPYASDPDSVLGRSYDQLRVQPARDALRFLAAQPGVDPTRLLVFGQSEGGVVASALIDAPGDAPAIAGLGMIEPGYTRLMDTVRMQLGDQLVEGVALGVVTAEDAAVLAAWMQAGIDEIRHHEAPYPDPGPVPLPGATGPTAQLQAAIQNSFYGSDPLQMLYSHSYRNAYGKQVDEIDPEAIAPEVDVPTLVTCGTKDVNTPCGDGSPGSGVLALAAAYRPGIATLGQPPNMVHVLRDVGDDDPQSLADAPDYPFSAALAEEMAAFLATFTAADETTTTTGPAPTTTAPAVSTSARPVAASPRFTG